MDPEKKSLNFIFPTKYVIPKSLKFSHWPSKKKGTVIYIRVHYIAPTRKRLVGFPSYRNCLFMSGTSQVDSPKSYISSPSIHPLAVNFNKWWIRCCGLERSNGNVQSSDTSWIFQAQGSPHPRSTH